MTKAAWYGASIGSNVYLLTLALTSQTQGLNTLAISASLSFFILHEICHIRHKNHSKEFWQLVKKYMPEYESIHDELGDAKL